MKIRYLIILIFLTLPGSDLFSFGKNKVDYETYKWRVLKTIHFDIHYPEGMDLLASTAAGIAERGYIRIAAALSHELTDPVPVIVFPSHIAFQNTSIIPDMIGEGTGGFTEALKNRVVVPFNGSYDDFNHVLVHELVHAFQFNILFSDTSGNVKSKFMMRGIPLWFIEGMAEYLSIGLDESCDMFIRDALFNDSFSSLKDLTAYRIRTPYQLYKQGQSFMYFIEEKYGRYIIGEMLRDFRDMDDYGEVFKVNTGKDIDDLSTEWMRFYKKRYYGLVPVKKYDDDDGTRLLARREGGRGIALRPAVSPDGKKLAYISNEDIYPSLYITEIGADPEKAEKITLAVSGISAAYESLNLMRNSLSWSPDGTKLFFAAQSGGGDLIYGVSSADGRVTDRIIIPMRSISEPRLSPDGRSIVFIGSSSAGSDIFIYRLESRKLERLTDDMFTERSPVFSSDNKTIIFAADRPGAAGESPSAGFEVYSIDASTGKTEQITSGYGDAAYIDVSADGKKILFTSNRTGIYNAYIYDTSAKTVMMATDILSGVSQIRWVPGKDEFVYVSFMNTAYDIYLKKSDEASLMPVREQRDTFYFTHPGPVTYVRPDSFIFSDYKPVPSADWLLLGLSGAYNYGVVSFVQMSMSDNLGEHRFIFTGNHIYQEGSSDLNFDAAYFYLKQRTDIGIGAFRQKNPFWIYSLTAINDLIHNVNYGTIYMDYYGGYMVASYPFSRFLRADFKTTLSRYERDYSVLVDRTDVFANLNQVSAAVSYDNVLWGPMIPLDGFRGRAEFEQSVDLTGNDFVYSSLDIDLRKYFYIGGMKLFAFRAMAGRIFGRDADYFKYYTGGYNTVRGHPFMAYMGKNMLAVNSEFRFIFIEGIKMGWPIPLRIGSIGGVLFLDTAAVWDKNIVFSDPETGEWSDPKAGAGFGFRLNLYPLIILKLDYAWPFSNKSIGGNDIIFSMGFEY